MSSTKPKPSVFIGSSSEGLRIAHALQSSLQSECNVTTWDQDLFNLTKSTFENLREVSESFDFAIIVFSADGVTSERGRNFNTPNANVVFEAGFFIGTLGSQRTIVVCCEDDAIKLPTDLHGTTIAPYSHREDGNLQAALNKPTVKILKLFDKLGPRIKMPSGPLAFPRSDSSEFTGYLENLLPDAKRVVLMGTGLNILHRDPLRTELMARASRNECSLEIYLADPDSPSVGERLVEEELGQLPPPVGRGGLKARLDNLVAEWRSLNAPQSISIRLFRHYPTFALLIVDSHYFVYPYGYATLGNYSPVFRFSTLQPSDIETIKFLDRQYHLVNSSSVDVYEALEGSFQSTSLSSNRLKARAVYFIPDAATNLYQFGSAILGYDVRQGRQFESLWKQYTGTASAFGFHLTCADVLYFSGSSGNCVGA